MSDSVATLRREVFQIKAETQRLLAPILMVMDSQIATLVDGARKVGTDDRGELARELASLIELCISPDPSMRPSISSVLA